MMSSSSSVRTLSGHGLPQRPVGVAEVAQHQPLGAGQAVERDVLREGHRALVHVAHHRLRRQRVLGDPRVAAAGRPRRCARAAPAAAWARSPRRAAPSARRTRCRRPSSRRSPRRAPCAPGRRAPAAGPPASPRRPRPRRGRTSAPPGRARRRRRGRTSTAAGSARSRAAGPRRAGPCGRPRRAGRPARRPRRRAARGAARPPGAPAAPATRLSSWLSRSSRRIASNGLPVAGDHVEQHRVADPHPGDQRLGLGGDQPVEGLLGPGRPAPRAPSCAAPA